MARGVSFQPPGDTHDFEELPVPGTLTYTRPPARVIHVQPTITQPSELFQGFISLSMLFKLLRRFHGLNKPARTFLKVNPI